MVTRSVEDFNQHCKDIYKQFAKKYGKKKAWEFINFYYNRYKKFNRSMLAYKTAWSIYDDYKQVMKTGIRWYAFVGTAGQGKSTLAKNVLYFLDNTFNERRTCTTYNALIKKMRRHPKDAMKSFLMDEPEPVHPMSKEGKWVSTILGKSRQQKVFIAFCATKMNDIPSFIYRMITGIFFVSKTGEAFFFKDRPKEYVYVINDIKEGYAKKGYKIFFQFAKSKGCVRMHTTRHLPQTKDEIKSYEKNKWEDYANDMDEYLKFKKKEKDDNIAPKKDTRMDIIKQMLHNGLSTKDIAKNVGITQRRVQQLLKN